MIGVVRYWPALFESAPEGFCIRTMPEIPTESYCERCGAQVALEHVRRDRPIGFGRLPGLPTVARGLPAVARGLRDYVLNEQPFLDALARARQEERGAASAHQLDAFHRAFNFCIECRQYVCRDCWNDDAGRCRTCEPIAVSALEGVVAVVSEPPAMPAPLPVLPQPLPLKPEPLPVAPAPLSVAPAPLSVAPEPLPVAPEPLPAVAAPVAVMPEPLPAVPEFAVVFAELVAAASEPIPDVPELTPVPPARAERPMPVQALTTPLVESAVEPAVAPLVEPARDGRHPPTPVETPPLPFAWQTPIVSSPSEAPPPGFVAVPQAAVTPGTCPSCRLPVSRAAQFCRRCGAPLSQTANAQPDLAG